MDEQKIVYFIRTSYEYKTVTEAQEFLNSITDSKELEIGYYMPQPQYKSWVPNFLIKLLTKKQ